MSAELQDLVATFLMTGITDWGRLASDIGPRLSQHRNSIFMFVTCIHTQIWLSALILFLENKKIHKFSTRKIHKSSQNQDLVLV